MNYYLRLRSSNQLTAVQKFMLSLMSVFVLFVLYYAVAFLWGTQLERMMGADFNITFGITFTITMILVLPITTTELTLWLYKAFIEKRKN